MDNQRRARRGGFVENRAASNHLGHDPSEEQSAMHSERFDAITRGLVRPAATGRRAVLRLLGGGLLGGSLARRGDPVGATCAPIDAACSADDECCDAGSGVRCCSGRGSGFVCTPTVGPTCPQPPTSCVAPLTDCGDVCVDLSSNPWHCGDCFDACPLGWHCRGGRCRVFASLLLPPA